jgi:hypothetical protein
MLFLMLYLKNKCLYYKKYNNKNIFKKILFLINTIKKILQNNAFFKKNNAFFKNIKIKIYNRLWIILNA